MPSKLLRDDVADHPAAHNGGALGQAQADQAGEGNAQRREKAYAASAP